MRDYRPWGKRVTPKPIKLTSAETSKLGLKGSGYCFHDSLMIVIKDKTQPSYVLGFVLDEEDVVPHAWNYAPALGGHVDFTDGSREPKIAMVEFSRTELIAYLKNEKQIDVHGRMNGFPVRIDKAGCLVCSEVGKDGHETLPLEQQHKYEYLKRALYGEHVIKAAK